MERNEGPYHYQRKDRFVFHNVGKQKNKYDKNSTELTDTLATVGSDGWLIAERQKKTTKRNRRNNNGFAILHINYVDWAVRENIIYIF